jgi:hypothetical protein
MNGCGPWQSPMRLPNHRPSRSAGRSQERRQPARVSERTLDGAPARRLSDALRNIGQRATYTHCQIEY